MRAAVRSSGLAAGYAGAYRVQVDIPDGAKKGDVQLLLSNNGIDQRDRHQSSFVSGKLRQIQG
jgi:uncharacterized protein (TIGR03437 family)